MRIPAPLLLLPGLSEACLSCNAQVRAGIFNGSFGWNLFLVFLPFSLVGLFIFYLHRWR